MTSIIPLKCEPCKGVLCVPTSEGIGRAALRRQGWKLRTGFIIKIYDMGSGVSLESAESGTYVIRHTFKNISTVVIVHWIENFSSRVEQDGTLKMDFRIEVHSQEAK